MGGHFHNETTEIFYILSGNVSVYTFKELDDDGKLIELGPGKCFIIGVREYHYIEALSKSILVVLLSKPYDVNNPDIHTGGLLGKTIEVRNRHL